MYWEQSAVVKTEFGTTIEFQIKKGARQGCILSSLFNLYTEKKFKEEEETNKIVIGGVKGRPSTGRLFNSLFLSWKFALLIAVI